MLRADTLIIRFDMYKSREIMHDYTNGSIGEINSADVALAVNFLCDI